MRDFISVKSKGFIDHVYKINFFDRVMRNDKENIIVDRSFKFSVKIIEFTDSLFEQKRFSLANQLLKSGTSIGANVKEAQNAESEYDFIHKMKIAAKEADETEYWLELCRIFGSEINNLITECREIQLILSKIISTSKRNLKGDK